MKQYAIIVAGGKGLRMGNELPKQFLLLCGKPVLMHTLEVFHHFDPCLEIILVLPEEQQDFWKKLCINHNFSLKYQLVNGGTTRFHSVRNGLKFVNEKTIVGIHDGVRPLVSEEVIARLYENAASEGAAFPVIPVTDTLRRKDTQGSHTVDRTDYCLVQTPQVFHSDLIKKAYEQEFSEQFTDDVSVLEASGYKRVVAVEGSRENIKITTPVDLVVAEAIMQSV